MSKIQIEEFINASKWYPARKLIVEALKESPTDIHLWELLLETYLNQKYYFEAYELIQYIYTISPNYRHKQLMEKLQSQEEHFVQRQPSFKELINLKSTTVTVCLIFKNNVDTIKQWYDSVKGKFDQIVVVDTGSNDGTGDFLKARKDVTYTSYPWDNNFSNARNAAHPFITSKWVFWLDSDDYIEDNKFLNQVKFVADYYETLGEYGVICVEYINNFSGIQQSNFDIPRMYMNELYKYDGIIHETPVSINENINVENINSGIRVFHTGYEEGNSQSEKLMRNIKMLEVSVENNPTDIYSWFYLAREHRLLNQVYDAIKYFKITEQLILEKGHSDLLIDIYRNLSICYYSLKDYENANIICSKGLNIVPDFPDFIYLMNLMKFETAVKSINEVFLEAKNIKELFLNNHFPITPDESIFLWRSDKLIADALKYGGFLKESRQLLVEINKKYPSLNFEHEINFINNQLQ